METTDYRERYEMFRKINAGEWDSTAKVVGTAVFDMALDVEPDGTHITILTTYKAIADKVNLSRTTVSQAVQRLKNGGAVKEAVTDHTIVNDWYNVETRITVDLAAIQGPARLGKLSDTDNQVKNQQKKANLAQAQRDIVKTAKVLLETVCPHCGERGLWHLTCGACGIEISHDELAQLVAADRAANSKPDLAEFDPAFRPMADINAELTEDLSSVKPLDIRENSAYVAQTDNPYPIVAPTDTRISTKAGGISESATVRNAPSVTEPTEAPVSPISTTDALLSAIPESSDILTGVDTIDHIADLYPDVNFYMAEPRSKKIVIPKDDQGFDLPWGHITLDAAKRWLTTGGNVGIVGDGWLTIPDVDDNAYNFILKYARFEDVANVFRGNADRAKFLIFTDGNCPTHKYEGNGHTVDLLGLKGKAIVAGTHESGATIKYRIGRIPALTVAEIQSILEDWTGSNTTMTPRVVTPTTARALKARPADASFVRDVFRWANQHPGYQAEAARLLSGCKRKGAYVAVRADDRTPSAKLDHDAYAEQNGPTLHDYGTGEKWDVCETIIRLRPIDKRILLWDELVPAYKRATGM